MWIETRELLNVSLNSSMTPVNSGMLRHTEGFPVIAKPAAPVWRSLPRPARITTGSPFFFARCTTIAAHRHVA